MNSFFLIQTIYRTQVPAPSRLSAISTCMRSGREAGSALSQKRSTCTCPKLSGGNMISLGVKVYQVHISKAGMLQQEGFTAEDHISIQPHSLDVIHA